MSKIASATEFFDVKAVGPVAQFSPTVSPLPFPTLDESGGAAPKWTSDLIPAGGMKAISAGVTLSRAGTLKIIRYVDEAGAVVLKTDSVNLVAATANSLSVVDGLPFGSFKVEIANTDNVSGHTATITAFGLLLNAA